MNALLHADYFSDPRSSWSWIGERVRNQLVVEFGDQIAWTLRVCGLHEHFEDDVFNLDRYEWVVPPRIMAGVWRRNCPLHRMPVAADRWLSNPIKSSHPGCLAVKAAQRQGAAVGERFLRALREGYLTTRLPLDRRGAILALARGVRGLDTRRFARDLDAPETLETFRQDWRAAREPLPAARDIKVFATYKRYAYPTLVLRNRRGQTRVLDADHPYAACAAAARELAPRIRSAPAPPPVALFDRFDSLSTEEVCLLAGLSRPAALASLRGLARTGLLSSRQAGGERLWRRGAAATRQQSC